MLKEFPEQEYNSEDLFQLLYEPIKWEILKTAIQVSLFDHCVLPITATDLAQNLSFHARNTEHLLNALVAMGFLTKHDGQFQNTKRTNALLTSGKETSLGASLLFMESWSSPILNGGLLERVKNGPPPPQDIASGDLWEHCARQSINYTRNGRAQLITQYVSGLPEFNSFSKILDMGSGPGIIGLAVAAAHPSLECVCMDQEPVCKVIKEVVSEYGAEQRVSIRPGDYMTDDFGSGYDFIMANFTLNFYRDRLDELMSRVFDSLNPGGIFMVTSDGMSEDGTQPAESVISWLSTMIQGNDLSLKSGKIAEAMHKAGFISTEMRTLYDSEVKAHGPVEMTFGRKKPARL